MSLPEYPVYLALTRPALNRLGLPQKGMLIVVGVTVAVFLETHNPVTLITIGGGLFLLMRILTAWDPNFFNIIQLWGKTKGRALSHPLRWLWGGSLLSALPSGIPDDSKDIASAL